MKARYILSLLLVSAFSNCHANQQEEELSIDFLEFLADMDEVTGDGFINWLKDESEFNDRTERNAEKSTSEKNENE